jgi:enoyl-CoA hydratase
VILLKGAGKAFCSGYDLKIFAETPKSFSQKEENLPWDPYLDYKLMKNWTEKFMSLFYSLKPTIC